MVINREHFYDVLRTTMYPTGTKLALVQPQVDGINFLLDKLEADDRVNVRVQWLAYILATVKRECGDEWEPIAERGPRRYFNRYNFREDLGHRGQMVTLADGSTVNVGWAYRGRGYPQTTGLINYTWLSKRLGIDLVSDPDKMLDRNVAYQSMIIGMTEGRFTGKKLLDYINDQKVAYLYARRIINGLDHASEIAAHAKTFELALAA